jgi:hypothetical protein
VHADESDRSAGSGVASTGTTSGDSDTSREVDTARPEHEPGPAERSTAPADRPLAPDGDAPDLGEIQPGEGPGQSPGE